MGLERLLKHGTPLPRSASLWSATCKQSIRSSRGTPLSSSLLATGAAAAGSAFSVSYSPYPIRLSLRHFTHTANTESIHPDEIAIMDSDPVGQTTDESGQSTSSASRDTFHPAMQAASSPQLPSVYRDAKKVDSYARGRVVNFFKRYKKNSTDDIFDMETINGDQEGEEERAAGTVYHCRLCVPLSHPLLDSGSDGGLWAHGVASDAKTAERLAAMHAEHIIDELGYLIYSLPSMQRKHVKAAAKEGRYAPSPDEEASTRTLSLDTFPLPLRRVETLDESENGEWQLLEVRQTSYIAPPTALLSPCVFDKAAEQRVRGFFRDRSLTFASHCIFEEEESMVAGGAPFHIVSITFPVELFTSFELTTTPKAQGKALSVEDAVVLACMHAELLLDALYIPLFLSDEQKQKSHALAAWSFGRSAPMLDAAPKNPSHILLPLPLKQLVIAASGVRYSKLNREEDLVRRQRYLTEQTIDFFETTVQELSAVEDLRHYLRTAGDDRYEHPFFSEKIQHNYKSTVVLPVDASHGICGGIGVASSKRDADVLAAMHALDLLVHFGVPVKSHPEEQAQWLKKRASLLGNSSQSIGKERPLGRRLGAKGFQESVSIEIEDEEETESSAGMAAEDDSTTSASPIAPELSVEDKLSGASLSAPRARVVKRAAAKQESGSPTPPATSSEVDGKATADDATPTAAFTMQMEEIERGRASIPAELWKLESDTPDGYIRVNHTTAQPQLLEVAIRSPRELHPRSKVRMTNYLAHMGRRFEDVFKTRSSERKGNYDEEESIKMYECIGTLPVPLKFGDRFAMGKADHSQEDAEVLASMHAELILDRLGICLFSDMVQQQRHAKECAKCGRWAPRDAESQQDGGISSPPPLQLAPKPRASDRPSDSLSRSRKVKRIQPRSVSSGKRPVVVEPEPSVAEAMPLLQLDPQELNEIPDMGDVNHTIVSEEDLDLVSKARVMYYLRRQGKSVSVDYQSMMGKGTLIHVATGQLPLPSGEMKKMEGIAMTKRDAEVLAWVHAERTLDSLGIEIFDNLPKLQQYHATKAVRAGRWAPSLSTSDKGTKSTEDIPPLRLSSFLRQLTRPVLSSMSQWHDYVSACDEYIKERRMQMQNVFFDQERVPRTGDVAIDTSLDEVESKKVDSDSKRLLQLYCNSAELDYPPHFPVRVAGPLSHRVAWVSIPVPGFPQLVAQGVGSSKDVAQRRAAMHALAILKLVDKNFEIHHQDALSRLLEAKAAPESAAPLLFGSSEANYHRNNNNKNKAAGTGVAIWDRDASDFTYEGKERLLYLYTVCCGLPAPVVEDRVSYANGRVSRSTVVEVIEEEEGEGGKRWTGRGTNSSTSMNRKTAVEAVFDQMAGNHTMHQLMDFLRDNNFLDPAKIASVDLTDDQRSRINAIVNECAPEVRKGGDDAFQIKQSFRAQEETTTFLTATSRNAEQQEALSQILGEKMKAKLNAEEYKEKFEAKRQRLSIWDHKESILHHVTNNQVLILCGTTGCGKTTQVPQFILDHYTEKGEGGACSILVTQPRRISAVSIAHRVAAERLEQIGDTCGYSIRFDTKLGKSINFCTSGILLRMLHTTPLLDSVNMLIIDEIHERDINSDFILVLLQGLLRKRSDLRVILMSATLQADLFSQYFGNAPVVNVEGYVHPVQELFLEDLVPMAEEQSFMTPLIKEVAMMADRDGLSDDFSAPSNFTTQKYGVLEAATEIDYVSIQFAIEQAERMVDLTDSSILVFLPGWEEIVRAKEILERKNVYQILPLHSSVSSEEQMQCFLPAENGKRKVILSTNIAESGVTIDDIGAVIDVGRAKEKSYMIRRKDNENDNTGYFTGTVSQLLTVYASRANCTQRRGRVGRTRPGICIRLYTRQHFNQLHDFQTPEMLRTPLDTLCLHILSLQLGDPSDFLREALEPPPEQYVEAAMSRLHELGATTANRELTALGMRLSMLPVDPNAGKMILMGAVFRCLDSALTIASVTQTDVFSSQREHREAVRLHRENFSHASQSDAIASLNGYNFWVSTRSGREPTSVHHELESRLLSVPQLLLVSRLKRQFFSIIRTSRFLGREMQQMAEKDFDGDEPEVFVEGSDYSSDTLNVGLVKCIVASGLLPSVAMNRGKRLMRTKEELYVSPSTDSVVYKTKQECIQQPFFVYSELSKSQESGRHRVRGLTAIPLWTLLLMGNTEAVYRHDLSLGIIDEWIVFRASFDVVQLIKSFKTAFRSCLNRKFTEPDNKRNNERLDRICEMVKELVNTAIIPNNLVDEEWKEHGIILGTQPVSVSDNSAAVEGAGEAQSAVDGAA